MSKINSNFTSFNKENIGEPFLNTWTIKISPETLKNEMLDNFIENISEEGLIDLMPHIDKKYKLVALQIKIQKSIFIYSAAEWKMYTN